MATDREPQAAPRRMPRAALPLSEEPGAGVRAHVESLLALGHHGGRLVVGWVFDPRGQLLCMDAVVADVTVTETAGTAGAAAPATELELIPLLDRNDGVRLLRTHRPDVRDALDPLREAVGDEHGFVLYLPPALDAAGLALRCRDGGVAELPLPTQPAAAPTSLRRVLEGCWPHAAPALRELVAEGIGAGDIDTIVAELASTEFGARIAAMPALLRDPQTTFASIDRVFVLGGAGLLVFGWHFETGNRVVALYAEGADARTADLAASAFRLPRQDVIDEFAATLPELPPETGFLLHAPLPTRVGELRALRFVFADGREECLRLPTDAAQPHGVALIKQVLAEIPAPDRLRHRFAALFDSVGPALQSFHASCRTQPPAVQVRAFGTPVDDPRFSVIVPLYGRGDFMRHQLVQFADDPDFGRTDLIYVVDDPALLQPVLDMAANFHALLGLAFRVVWYGCNRGFAGANNIAAVLARAPALVLLNSDVLPQQHGWLACLDEALHRLPAAGMVAPLLQFADGSVQHAGMVPREDPFLPGFLMNAHPGKGMPWAGADEPAEQPLLTAACVMLRREDYLQIGGLDEGYVVGDFEDSDLCLALRKRGRRLWLVPRARLWHLERQSQNAGSSAWQRQLLTLFNAWRYRRRIEAGVIADPRTEVRPCA